MHIYDSAIKKKAAFKPIKSGKISIYLCGPTVYDDAHLGHARSSVSFDLLRRVLIALGFRVSFARNFTDIDDKILNKMATNNESLEIITNRYIKSYEDDMSALNILPPDFAPKATDNIAQIIVLIEQLLNGGSAYVLDDGIYFDTSKDSEYLKLSHRMDENLVARIEQNQSKKDPKDFALWKFDEGWYEAPFGAGRPGWHTECVAMIAKIFDSEVATESIIDIHAGGADLLFPHHENEAAQCRCAYHKKLANHWMHNGFVRVSGEKMSKSLGNSFFLKDAFKIAPGEAVRFYLLSSHYRADFDYNIDDLNASKKRLDKIYRLAKRIGFNGSGDGDSEIFKNSVLEPLKDDLNISVALSILDEMVINANAELDKTPKNKQLKAQIASDLAIAADIFGILQTDINEWFCWGVSEEQKAQIRAKIAQRSEAKKSRDFALADEIRNELLAIGVELQDTASGTVWEKV